MVIINKDEILKQGYVDIKVRVTGMRQGQRLHVVEEDSPHGKIPTLVAKHYIPRNELVKLADLFQLPVRHKNNIALPKGKMPKDLAIPGTKPTKVVVESDEIEAEIED